jgi:hypothetical protein
MSDWLAVFDAANDLETGFQYAQALQERFALGPGHGDMALQHQAFYARFVSRAGRLDDADAMIEELLASEADVTGSTARSIVSLAIGGHLAARGRLEEAEQRLLDAHQPRSEKVFGIGDRIRVVVRQELARLYEKWGRADEAQRWSALALQPAEGPPLAGW